MHHLKKVLTIILVLIGSTVFAQTDSITSIENKKAHAGCLKCVFHVAHKCALGVKIDNKTYPVEGSSLKDHGKPRAKNGLCKEEREVKISGRVEQSKFFAYDFQIIPVKSDLPLPIEVEDSLVH